MSVQPKPGDLLLVHAPSVYQDAIEFAERISLFRQGAHPPRGHPVYGHVAVYIGEGYILEALGRGLTRSPITKYAGSADIWTRQISRSSRDRIVLRAIAMWRARFRYSWLLIGILAVRLLFGWRLPWHQRGSLVCSVYGYDCWAADKVQIAASRACSPEDIAVYGRLYFAGEYKGVGWR